MKKRKKKPKVKAIEYNAINPNDHLGLLFWFCKNNARESESVREIIGPCAESLIRAAQIYNPDDGRAKFSTYAVKAMRGGLLAYRDEQKRGRYLAPIRSDRYGPIIHKFSELGFTFETGQSNVFATDYPNETEEKDRHGSICRFINDAMRTLNENQSNVLKFRWGIGDGVSRTLRETGKMINRSVQRVRELEAQAFIKIRKLFSDYPDDMM